MRCHFITMLSNKCILLGASLWISVVCHRSFGFIAQRNNQHCITYIPIKSTVALSAAATHGEDNVEGLTMTMRGRREWMRVTTSTLLATASSITVLANSMPEQAMAATVESGDVIWKTGRAPIIPGKTPPSDKGDVKGTRKDPNFLRSVADCKGKCENSLDSDGLARSATECLQACQDICCTTYEQCTFTIVR